MADSNNKHKWTCQLGDYTSSIISDRQKRTSLKGTASEYQAIAELTKQGFFVAKAVDPACPFDIVIVSKKGKIELLDIKTNSYRDINNPNWEKKSKKIYRTPTDIQKKLNIKLLMLDYED